LIYGGFKSVPSSKPEIVSTQIGSTGIYNVSSTYGGGRVVIYADSIIIQGTGARIQANGLCNPGISGPLHGGTGGYIYIKTYNLYGSNSMDSGGLIEANGGSGLNNGFGGSGGIIIMDHFNPPINSVSAYGGVAAHESLCDGAGAGTIYYADYDLLIIDNDGVKTMAAY
jgi:hypothetical protein